MQLVELLLGDLAGRAHEDILRILVHRERDDLADAVLAGQQHDHAVDARGDTGMGGCAVAEGVVHGREFLLHVALAEANELEGLDHDLRIVVPDRAGGQLDAVADEVILLRGDGQRVNFAPDGLIQRGSAAARHGERIVAELQLTGFVADLIHREVDDPAELVAFLVHVALDVRAEGLDEHARELRRRSARGDHDEGIGRFFQQLPLGSPILPMSVLGYWRLRLIVMKFH